MTAVPLPPSGADSSGDAADRSGGMWSDWQGLLLLGFPVLLVFVTVLIANRQRRRRFATHPIVVQTKEES
jgi:hypothetical protein